MTINLSLSSFYFGYSLAYLGTFDYRIIKTIFDVKIEKSLA